MRRNEGQVFAIWLRAHAHRAPAGVRSTGGFTPRLVSVAVGQEMPDCYCFSSRVYVGKAKLAESINSISRKTAPLTRTRIATACLGSQLLYWNAQRYCWMPKDVRLC